MYKSFPLTCEGFEEDADELFELDELSEEFEDESEETELCEEFCEALAWLLLCADDEFCEELCEEL